MQMKKLHLYPQVAKTGRSGGIGIAIAIASKILNLTPPSSYAAMGDIWADGTVHKVGGLAAKLEAAAKIGCEFIILPSEMEEEFMKLTKEQQQGLYYFYCVHAVEKFMECEM
uniref:Lon proteolytic domain-containing protein n=1 Tax=Meloidogyne incognita TaxID=6306 RepID=A0A914LTN1_MELIC